MSAKRPKPTAQDPSNFDADPDRGSALEKMNPDPDPGYFFAIYELYLLIFMLILMNH